MLGSQNWPGDGVLRNRDASFIIVDAEAANYDEKIFLEQILGLMVGSPFSGPNWRPSDRNSRILTILRRETPIQRK
jgi:hypothetical protein